MPKNLSTYHNSIKGWKYKLFIPIDNPLCTDEYGDGYTLKCGDIDIIKKFHKNVMHISNNMMCAYVSDDVSTIIPSNFKSGYEWILWKLDDDGEYTIQISLSDSKWFIDHETGLLIFFQNNLSNGIDLRHPPAITFYRYVGPFGNVLPYSNPITDVDQQGIQGSQGNHGLDGLNGQHGLQGIAGLYDILGVQGYKGDQGPQGLTGFHGDNGIGTQGQQGFQGTIGLSGYQGLKGEQGYQGFQGPIGLQGTAGISIDINQSSFTWRGNWSSLTLYEINDVVSYNGSSYITSSITIATIPPNNPSVWSVMVHIGNQGYQGYQGSRGFQGNQGTQGLIGHQGVQGFQGPIGLSIMSMTSTLIDYSTITNTIDNDVVVSSITATTKPVNSQIHYQLISNNFPVSSDVVDYMVYLTIGGRNIGILPRTLNWRATLNNIDIGNSDSFMSVTSGKYWYVLSQFSLNSILLNDVIGIKLWGSASSVLDFRYMNIYLVPRIFQGAGFASEFAMLITSTFLLSGSISGVTYIPYSPIPSVWDTSINSQITTNSGSLAIKGQRIVSAPLIDNNSVVTSNLALTPTLASITPLRYVRRISL